MIKKKYITGAITLTIAIALWVITIMPHYIILEEILETCKTETGHDKDCIDKMIKIKKIINNLCKANPKVECKRIQDYCQESLELGQECYLLNFPIY